MTAELITVQNYIYGQFEEAELTIDSIEPATGKVWAKIPDSNGDIVDRAVVAAKSAFNNWSRLSPAKRAYYLLKASDKLESRLDEFARMESRDQGKPVAIAKKMDIPRAIYNLRSFGEAWQHLTETANEQPEAGVINYSTRQPVGVAGLISPWNLPLYLLTFKIAPALMAGNTVVCKPSEMTSVTAWMLCQIFHEIGLPVGVLNLVCGYGPKAGDAIVRHPDVRVISFTGSTAVGRNIARIGGPMMKKLSLELGGKNPGIVFGDTNLEKALPNLIRSCFLNQGEICLCTSRLFVHKSIFDEFKERFVELAKKLRVGDPEDSGVFVGALISADHKAKVKRYIGYAKEEGGHIECGEMVSELELDEKFSGGYFMQPTVITGLPDDSRCMKEEIFGPVVCITPFSTEEEVIRRANDVDYGLCASVYTENLGLAHRVASGLEVGTVWINCWLIRSLDMPFGGCKGSGIGREGLRHSMEAFTEEKTVCIKVRDDI